MSAERENVILLDGGMGQELRKRSCQPVSPLWSAQHLAAPVYMLNIEHGRDRI